MENVCTRSYSFSPSPTHSTRKFPLAVHGAPVAHTEREIFERAPTNHSKTPARRIYRPDTDGRLNPVRPYFGPVNGHATMSPTPKNQKKIPRLGDRRALSPAPFTPLRRNHVRGRSQHPNAKKRTTRAPDISRDGFVANCRRHYLPARTVNFRFAKTTDENNSRQSNPAQ